MAQRVIGWDPDTGQVAPRPLAAIIDAINLDAAGGSEALQTAVNNYMDANPVAGADEASLLAAYDAAMGA